MFREVVVEATSTKHPPGCFELVQGDKIGKRHGMEDEEESEAEWLGKRIETQRFFEDFDLLVGCLEKSKNKFPKWWFIGDLPW